ncbi:MAG: hypothetical protein CR964_00365 [Rhodobacterales bacterium]|nr:MAG: hypothetical protein CR964_00365 [Rhodobacterales bacterium]
MWGDLFKSVIDGPQQVDPREADTVLTQERWWIVVSRLQSCLLSLVALSALSGAALADPIGRLTSAQWSINGEDSAGCSAPVWFRLSQGGDLLTATHSRPVRLGEEAGGHSVSADFQVLKQQAQWVKLRRVGETLQDHGKRPVTWMVYFLDDERFVWMRSDWPHGHTSRVRRRCPAVMG